VKYECGKQSSDIPLDGEAIRDMLTQPGIGQDPDGRRPALMECTTRSWSLSTLGSPSEGMAELSECTNNACLVFVNSTTL
jgi:hypothetical protein